MLRFRAQLTQLHPAWSLALIFANICTGWVAITTHMIGLHLAMTFASCLLPLLWAQGVYERARSAAGVPPVPWVSRLYAGVQIALIVIAGLMLVVRPEPLQAMTGGAPALVVLPYFACFWIAAAALVKGEGRPDAFSWTLGAFLLMVYWVIGAWFIQPRVARLDEAATPSGTPGSPPSR